MGLSGSDATTNVNIATLSGAVVQTFTVGAINLFFATETEVAHNMAEAFVTAQMSGYPIKSCKQVCAGIAGLLGNVQTATALVPQLRDVMRKCGYTDDALLIGDEQIALAGALGKQKGAILIAGDTSTCFGQNALGRQHRTGGMGILSDDDGSGYAIGREIIRAVARASDGRGAPTHLTSHVYRFFSLTGPADLTRLLRSANLTHRQICQLAADLPKACQSRDKVALGIVDKAVDQLVNLVVPVVERLSMKKDVLAVAGPILLNDAFIGIAFKKKISEKYPDLQCVPPRNDGAAGAVLLAKERLALRGFKVSTV